MNAHRARGAILIALLSLATSLIRLAAAEIDGRWSREPLTLVMEEEGVRIKFQFTPMGESVLCLLSYGTGDQ